MPLDDQDQRQRQQALEAVPALLRAHYIFPDRVDRIADALARLGADVADDPADWAAAVTTILTEASGDLHLRMHHSEAVLARYDPFEQTGYTVAEIAEERRRTRNEFQGITRVERLAGNVGYLRMREFVDPAFSGPAISAAMILVSGTDALIIDLRYTRGGSPFAVQLICSHFFDEFERPVHLNDMVENGRQVVQVWTHAWLPSPRYLDRPMWVLTSARTFSAAEELAYNLKVLGRATLVGERTRGGAHPSTRVAVGDHYSLNLPNARSVNPVTGTNWEAVGVEPDLTTSEDDAHDIAYRAALQAVIDAPGTDPDVSAEASHTLLGLAPAMGSTG